MQRTQGRSCLEIDTLTLVKLARAHSYTLLDIGAGDGRFVAQVARRRPDALAIGVDACRENLIDQSRRAPENALFLVANALALPAELAGIATRLTINFPWGSLLTGLLDGSDFIERLASLARPGATLEVIVNGGALAEAGWTLEPGAARIRSNLCAAGCALRQPVAWGASDLRACPTTWARRLAFGRDPRAVFLMGKWKGREGDDVAH
jgi:16S rRNA (adenine(1408)-N(1))-methyltransferase